MLICYNLNGKSQEINFLLKSPFSKEETLQIWEGEQEVIDSIAKSQIGSMIRESELSFYGMGPLENPNPEVDSK